MCFHNKNTLLKNHYTTEIIFVTCVNDSNTMLGNKRNIVDVVDTFQISQNSGQMKIRS